MAQSIAGMQAAQRILDESAAYLADPANWYGEPEKPKAPPYTTFAEYLANAAAGQGRDGEGTGGHPSTPPATIPPGSMAFDDLGVGAGEGPRDIMDAMLNAIIALRMYEANARMFSIEDRILGIIIHLGEENYRSD